MSEWETCPNLDECINGNRFGKGCVEDAIQSAMGGKPWHECHCGVDGDGNPPNRRQSDTITRLTAEVRVRQTIVEEARDERDAALAEVERLRAALEPFAHLYLWPFDHHLAEEIMADADWCEEENDVTEEELFIRRGYIRAARTALSGDKQ
jgi:hypothetical protein